MNHLTDRLLFKWFTSQMPGTISIWHLKSRPVYNGLVTQGIGHVNSEPFDKGPNPHDLNIALVQTDPHCTELQNQWGRG